MHRSAKAARDDEFTAFVATTEPRIRRALVAALGPEVGSEATAEAMAIAWERWDYVSTRPNPAGYVWGVGRNIGRKRLAARRRPLFPTPEPEREPWIEPGLSDAFECLTLNQRVSVILMQGFGWTHREVGELLGISIPSVQKHAARGMAKLRAEMGLSDG